MKKSKTGSGTERDGCSKELKIDLETDFVGEMVRHEGMEGV